MINLEIVAETLEDLNKVREWLLQINSIKFHEIDVYCIEDSTTYYFEYKDGKIIEGASCDQ